MRHVQNRAPRTALRLGLVLAALLLGLGAGAASAQVSDPVDDLVGALAIRLEDLANPTEAVLNYRRDVLQKRVDALKTLGQLRRALVLEEWKLQLPVDVQMRKLVADRFLRGLQVVIEKGDPSARMAAANMIAEMGPTVRAVDAGEGGGFARTATKDIITLTKDPSVEVRQEALRALGNINAPPIEAYPAFRNALEHDTIGPRRQAAAAIGQMVRVVNFLHKQGKVGTGIVATRGELIEVCRAAAAAASFGLADPDMRVRELALQAVDESARAIWYMIPEPYAKKEFPPDNRPLSDEERKDVADKQQVVQSEIKSVEGVYKAYRALGPLLARDLEASEFGVRDEASRAAEDIATARLRLIRRVLSVPAFSKKDESDVINQVKRLDPLGFFFENNNLGIISKLIQAPEARLRRRGVDTLELLGEDAQSQLPVIIAALCDPDRFVRWASARAISHIGPKEAAPTAVVPLGKLLSDNDNNVRLAASATLESMGPDARAAINDLAKAATTGDAETRVAAIYVLPSLGAENARPAVPALIESMSASDARVRRAAADVLGKLASVAQDAIPALRKALEDEDQDVRINAADALLALTEPRIP